MAYDGCPHRFHAVDSLARPSKLYILCGDSFMQRAPHFIRTVIPSALLTLMTLAVAPGQCRNWQSYQQFSQVATQCEHQGKWTQIHWLKDMEQAKARSRAE